MIIDQKNRAILVIYTERLLFLTLAIKITPSNDQISMQKSPSCIISWHLIAGSRLVLTTNAGLSCWNKHPFSLSYQRAVPACKSTATNRKLQCRQCHYRWASVDPSPGRPVFTPVQELRAIIVFSREQAVIGGGGRVLARDRHEVAGRAGGGGEGKMRGWQWGGRHIVFYIVIGSVMLRGEEV